MTEEGESSLEESRPGATVPRATSLFERLGAIGAAAQASVPGLYAWGVTVAPVVYARQATLLSKIAAGAGLVSLLLGIALERRWGARARYVAVWGLVLSSALVWILVPSALGPLRLDSTRGIAGMVGWALFAFASAAPALRRGLDTESRVVDDAPLRPRAQLKRGDAIYVGGGVVLALGLQVVGWGVAIPERALLVRLISIASGLAILGAATSIALSRHGRAPAAPSRVRFRRTLPWMLALFMFGVLGVIVWLRSS